MTKFWSKHLNQKWYLLKAKWNQFFNPKTVLKFNVQWLKTIPSLKLTAHPWQMDGWRTFSFPFGVFRPIFRGKLAVRFRECTSPKCWPRPAACAIGPLSSKTPPSTTPWMASPFPRIGRRLFLEVLQTNGCGAANPEKKFEIEKDWWLKYHTLSENLREMMVGMVEVVFRSLGRSCIWSYIATAQEKAGKGMEDGGPFILFQFQSRC